MGLLRYAYKLKYPRPLIFHAKKVIITFFCVLILYDAFKQVNHIMIGGAVTAIEPKKKKKKKRKQSKSIKQHIILKRAN